MKLRALRRLSGDYGTVDRNGIFTVTKNRGDVLVTRGLAVPADIGSKMKEVAAKGTDRPSVPPSPPAPPAPPRSGGPTGEEKPASSSQEGRQPKGRRSKKSEGEAES